MTTKQTVIIGCIIGLMASSVVIVLVWFGVAGVLIIGHTDYMYVFWPSSVMLAAGWRKTIPGITITIFLVVFNCLMYAAIALFLRACIRLIIFPFRKRDS